MGLENVDWRRVATMAFLVAIVAACADDPTAPSPADASRIESTHEEFTAIRATLLANTDLVSDLGHVRPVLDTLDTPFPPSLQGVTLEWHEEEDGYVATGRSGAPADGLRFIVYDRSRASLPEVGFTDVTDGADGDVSSRTVLLRKDEVTRLNYLIEDGGSSGALTASGFVTGGSRRVDFDVAQSVSTESGDLRLDLVYGFELEDPALALEVDYTLQGLLAPRGSFVATFEDGTDRLTIDIALGPGQAIGGEVLWNGEDQFAITGDDDGQPVFLTPAGEEPEPADERAVRGLYEFAFDGVGYVLPYLLFTDSDVAGSVDAWVFRPRAP